MNFVFAKDSTKFFVDGELSFDITVFVPFPFL